MSVLKIKESPSYELVLQKRVYMHFIVKQAENHFWTFLLVIACISCVNAQKNWTRISPYPASCDFVSIAQSDSQFVAVADDGTIIQSNNGIDWNELGFFNQDILSDVIWAGNCFVATGHKGVIMFSENGINWHSVSTGTDKNLNGAAWSGKVIVAVGDSGVIITSQDGKSWVSQLPVTTSSINDVAWNGEVFAAIGEGEFTSFGIYSKDGIHWSNAKTGAWRQLRAIASTGAGFVAVGLGGVMAMSQDGIEWAQINSGVQSDLYCIASNDSLIIAAGDSNMLLSENGTNWGQAYSDTAIGIRGVSIDIHQMISVGLHGTILASVDARKWTAVNRKSEYYIKAVAWTDSLLTAIDQSGAVITSPDGGNWNRIGFLNGSVNTLLWTGNDLLALGDTIFTSSDGIEWNMHNTVEERQEIIYSAVFGKDKFCAVGGSGYTRCVCLSADGEKWELQSFFHEPCLYGIAWSGDMFVAVGDEACIYTSSDGIEWKRQKTPSDAEGMRLFGIIWTGQRFVAAGQLGKIITSYDGISWQSNNDPQERSFYDVLWTGSEIVIAGGNTVLVSNDGDTWIDASPNITCEIDHVVWTGKQYYAFDRYDGSVLVSDGEWEAGAGPDRQKHLTGYSTMDIPAVCTGSRMNLTINLSRQSCPELLIYDLSGRLKCRLALNVISAGKHTVAVSLPALSVGRYIVSVKTGESGFKKSIVIMQ
jgi:hypothetical protein